MKNPLVSIVLPVWGVSSYVRQSFTSLLVQTYRQIEYIVVNDCTPDDSMEVIKQVQSSHSERDVKIFHHEKNKGLGASRATGLKHASGDFIICLDSDDFFEPSFIEDMVNSSKEFNSDIVICDYKVTYRNRERYIRQYFEGTGMDLCKEILAGGLQGFTWNKLIKRNLYLDCGICFLEGLNMWEDIAVIPRVCYFAKKVSYVPKAFIHYNQLNVNSYSTNKLSLNSLNNIISAVEIDISFLSDHPIKNQEVVLNSFKLRAKLFCLVNSKGCQRRDFNKLYPETKAVCFKQRLHPVYYNFIHIAAYFKFYFMIDFLWFMINYFRKYIK